MAVDALVPNDPRVENKSCSIGDLTYHYMLAKPESTPVATVVLCHGWYVRSLRLKLAQSPSYKPHTLPFHPPVANH